MGKNFLQKYARHIDVPEVGIEGQKKLSQSRVLIVGLGGLGCPSALYLAAAGIGTLGLADQDTVSLSNLQRQILYAEEDINQPKVNVAAKKLKAIAPDCHLQEYPFFITPGNARDIIAEYDVVLDCTDNFDTRYLLNFICFTLKKKLVSASVYHHDGQISVFRAFDGDEYPCYQCLYPKSDALTLAPQCKEGGILGPVTGIFGSMQAAVAINEILSIGDTLAGWLWSFSTLPFEAQKMKVSKRRDCEICSAAAQENKDFMAKETSCSI